MKGKGKNYSSPIYVTITVMAALLPAVCLLPASLSAQTLELDYSTYLGGSGWDEGGD